MGPEEVEARKPSSTIFTQPMTERQRDKPKPAGLFTMTSMGAASLATSLAATGCTGSAHAQEGEPQGESKEADSSPTKQLELLFLGTGAANWPRKYPFKDKSHPRAKVRAMSSMLVNGHILIDCGPTVLDVMNCYDVDPAGSHRHPADSYALGPLASGQHHEHRQCKGCQSWSL